MGNGAVDGGSTGAKPSPRPRIRLSPIGFWSYSRRDDELSRGRLSQLRSLLLAELQTQYGRDGIQLFQDVSAIPHGADWERITTGAIDESTFFIPIVTPFYMQSRWCARETKMFEAREEAIFETHPDLSRDRRRIFPLLWIDVKDVEALDEEAAAALKVAQWCDFSHLRHRNLDHDEEVLAKVAAFAKSIVDVLQLRVEAPLTAEERVAIAAAQQQHLREAAALRERDEEHRRRTESARQTEEGRRRREAETRRLEAEQAEAEGRAAEARAAAEQRELLELELAEREAARDARRARRNALLARQWEKLRGVAGSRLLWLGLPGAGALLLALWFVPALLGPGEESPRGGLNSSAGASARPTPEAPSVRPVPPPASIYARIHGRWCIYGNRDSAQTFSGDARVLRSSFTGGSQTEIIGRSHENRLVTDLATYSFENDRLIIEEAGGRQWATRC
jgi:hypothetical protein